VTIIGARERFAAGEIGLKDTGFGGFLEDAGTRSSAESSLVRDCNSKGFEQ